AKIRKAVKHDQIAIEALAKKIKATIILSDNRMGCLSSITKNYYMTHQVNIVHQWTWISWIGSKTHQYFIKKFDLCFVPDYYGSDAICPRLSQNHTLKLVHIGPITRITHMRLYPKYDICVVLSGPEPQRTVLEDRLFELLSRLDQYIILFIRGTQVQHTSIFTPKNIEVKNILCTEDMEIAFNSSKLLIARSGYSTIMDIESLDIKAILIPTPGQSEQEYLAKTLDKNEKYSILEQMNLNNLQKIIYSMIKF
ncbi:MAG: glycosyltransferase, partial [Saprospiraceae bacterium]